MPRRRLVQKASWLAFGLGVALVGSSFIVVPDPHDLGDESDAKRQVATVLGRTGAVVAIVAASLAYVAQRRGDAA